MKNFVDYLSEKKEYNNFLKKDYKKYFIEQNKIKKLLNEKIDKSKVLLVGAGGIGCEILKNLVLHNFKDITVIDLDTIDISNLNRQFLFRRNHISKPKAIIARESALQFNPDVKIKAYHDTIFNSNYGVGFFKQFTFIINALDNLTARNHVNRLCLAANVPLIETGSAGFHGQVEIIYKGHTQCYECQPKPTRKTYPGCTIRNTPSEPVHCIVWAKHLFNQLFGEEDDENEVSPDSSDPELAETNSELQNNGDIPSKRQRLDDEQNERIKYEEVGEIGNVTRTSTRLWANDINYEPEMLHKKFFIDDIHYLLSMANLWKSRRAPTPSHLQISKIDAAVADKYQKLDRTMNVWTWEMCTKVFSDSVKSLSERFKTLSEGDFLTWDKDDDVALDFVTACANIRAYIFGIEAKSRFDVKAIAGNIIPAIATTNAIVSGLAILQALKVLDNKMDEMKVIHVRKIPNDDGELFRPDRDVLKPNPKCYVCAPHPEVTVELDIERTTLKQFEEIILKQNLNMLAPDLMLAAKSQIIISSEEGETTSNNLVALHKLNITDGCILNADDFQQEYNVTIIIKHKKQERNDLFEFKISGNSDSKICDLSNNKHKHEEDEYKSPAKRLKV